MERPRAPPSSSSRTTRRRPGSSPAREVLDFFQIATGRGNLTLQIEQVKAAAGSDLIRKRTTAGDMRPLRHVTVIAIRKNDGNLFDLPANDRVIEAGDMLIVLGRPDDCKRMTACAAA